MASNALMTLILILLFLISVGGAPIDAEVKQFPGFDGEFPSKHYAGYIGLGDEEHKRHMYYYFATSERNSSEDPITLWLTGGPGCSGLDALAHLVGPFEVVPDTFHYTKQPKTRLSPYSWTKVSSILSVDSPVGTGYSYAENADDYITNDDKTVSDLYDFLIKWYSEYPEFLPNPLFLAACSYTGVIVPPLAQEIAKGIESGKEPRINLKGYSIGNGAYDVNSERSAVVPFANRIGLISDEHYQDLASSCQGKYVGNDDPDCLKNMKIFQSHIESINPYHVLCLRCHFNMAVNMDSYEHDSLKMYQDIHGASPFNEECHGYELASERLFESKNSRRIVNAAPREVTGQWIRCTKRLNYKRTVLSTMEYHLNLTKKGYKGFIYNGDHDLMFPYTGQLQWMKSFNYSVINKWHPWTVDGSIAGYAVEFENNLCFATFRGGGHTVTEYMPHEALVVIERWLGGASCL
ncbi:serine carboxypeptidase 1-like [Zingiber officinale]|uniref:serine carboxypeptidase 1-like n=1 Tax=Zingiber officinale TaxID=94328 RepID=UPI001C4CE38B|nr:serine carboxypeptidase 1-like [Zingiber officinale]